MSAYRYFRPLLFGLQPESIHHLIINLLRVTRGLPFRKCLLQSVFSLKDKSLEVEVLGMKFPNPVGLAAGFDKDAEAVAELSYFGFGFVEVGTLTPLAQAGNAKPRCFRLPKDKALINRMGFNNKGVEAAEKQLHKRKNTVIVGGNIGKNTLTSNADAAEDYFRGFAALYHVVDYFTVNVSCPNVDNLCQLQDIAYLTEILQKLTAFRAVQSQYKPILLKISPDLTTEQVDETLQLIEKEGIDGVVASNTTTSRQGLKTHSAEVTKIGKGGLSGVPLTQRNIERIRYIHQKTAGKLPIIGVGGIMTPEDAVQMLEAGASLIQVYTGFIYEGPGFVKQICKKLLKAK